MEYENDKYEDALYADSDQFTVEGGIVRLRRENATIWEEYSGKWIEAVKRD